MTTMTKVTVSVPATTANLGPGFDCLGLALGLYNQFTLEATAVPGLEIIVRGEGAAKIPTTGENLFIQAADRLFAYAGQRPSGWRLQQQNNIPAGSGLGSSATAVVGGLLAANTLIGKPCPPAQLLDLATAIEGHPDNVAPALLGGLVLCNQAGAGLLVQPLPIAEMQLLVVLPDFDLPTAVARAALPPTVPLRDAIFNIGRAGLLIHALRAGDYANLAVAVQDRLHQPYRLPLIPGMSQAFTTAQEAGAAAVALSGAGPSLVAFAPEGHAAIAAAVTAVFSRAGLTSRSWVLPISRQGARVVKRNNRE